MLQGSNKDRQDTWLERDIIFISISRRQINCILCSLLGQIQNTGGISLYLTSFHPSSMRFTPQVSENNKKIKQWEIIPISGCTKPNQNLPKYKLKQEKRCRQPGGGLPYWVILGMCGQNGWVFQAENLRMGVNFWPKTCGRVIILISTFTWEWVVFFWIE